MKIVIRKALHEVMNSGDRPSPRRWSG